MNNLTKAINDLLVAKGATGVSAVEIAEVVGTRERQTARGANHPHYGCDPGATAQRRDVYRGDRFLQTAYFCSRCRAALALEGFQLISD